MLGGTFAFINHVAPMGLDDLAHDPDHIFGTQQRRPLSDVAGDEVFGL
jgi:hypothetical protein